MYHGLRHETGELRGQAQDLGVLILSVLVTRLRGQLTTNIITRDSGAFSETVSLPHRHSQRFEGEHCDGCQYLDVPVLMIVAKLRLKT